ncbi:DUF4364 family protein [Alkaliphilus transvaalensis]|uniref:DUF4364 family protein n=1 Tax=Alkaliphilus transvaalensis TaxID=114628 RepID=UPI00047BDE26|nr:DUF4364 family protein [Alkaliphilus transvaalensis]
MFVNSSQQLAEKKLLLLYIFQQLEAPVTHSQMTDFILENELLNYFIFQQFLAELKDSGFISEEVKENEQIFNITDKGKDTLNYFIKRIPQKQLDKINTLLKTAKEDLIKKSEVIADYIKVKDGEFVVNLKVVENEIPIVSLSLNVATSQQAKLICENWRNNTQHIYGTIINSLIETPKKD